MSAPHVRGRFEPTRIDVAVGAPFAVELVLENDGDVDAYVFVPTGRADGLEISVLEGGDHLVAGLENEPEPGLVGEQRLAPGEGTRQHFPLSRWLELRSPGRYVVECGITVDVSERSAVDEDARRGHVEVRSLVELNASRAETPR